MGRCERRGGWPSKPRGSGEPDTIDGTDTFDFVSTVLIQHMNPWPQSRSVLVMDGASAHKWAPITEFFDALDIVYVLTPAYTPECNPIEVTFNTLKRDVRNVGYGLAGDALLDVIFRALWRHWEHSLRGPMRKAGLLAACRPWRDGA